MRTASIPVSMTIEEATQTWLAQYSSGNTRAAYGADLRSFLTWDGLPENAFTVTPELLARYRLERETSGLRASTVDRQFAALRAFFTVACQLGLCATNPLGNRPGATPPSSPTGALSEAEVARLHEAAGMLDPRTAVLVHLLVGEGLRLTEVLALDHADVSGPSSAKRLRINRHGRSVSLPLSSTSSRSIGRLQRVAGTDGPLLAGPRRGSAGPIRLTRFGADHLLKQAADHAGLFGRVSANVLRRTHVTAAHAAGVHIDDIRERMGHRDVRTTRRYTTPATRTGRTGRTRDGTASGRS